LIAVALDVEGIVVSDEYERALRKVEEADEWEARDLDRFLAGLKILCPKCGHLSFRYHVIGFKNDVTVVGWVCKNCGCEWSNSPPMKNGKVDFQAMGV
jgi:rubrerythrin